MTALSELATARIVRATDDPPHRRIPSLYADPASWAVLAAVDELLTHGTADAMVVVSTYGTAGTMTAIAGAVDGGRLSPLRFAGASTGGLASLACMVHGLRGPSLVITTDPSEGLPAARTMAGHWLRTGAATRVVIADHDHDPERGHEVRCTLVTSGEPR